MFITPDRLKELCSTTFPELYYYPIDDIDTPEVLARTKLDLVRKIVFQRPKENYSKTKKSKTKHNVNQLVKV